MFIFLDFFAVIICIGLLLALYFLWREIQLNFFATSIPDPGLQALGGQRSS